MERHRRRGSLLLLSRMEDRGRRVVVRLRTSSRSGLDPRASERLRRSDRRVERRRPVEESGWEGSWMSDEHGEFEMDVFAVLDPKRKKKKKGFN